MFSGRYITEVLSTYQRYRVNISKAFGWLQGHKNLLDLQAYLEEILPEHMPLPAGDEVDDEITKVAILCDTSFADTMPPTQCLHWIPGWVISNTKDFQNIFTSLLRQTERTENDKLEDLYGKKYLLDNDDEAEAVTLQFEIDRVRRKYSNLLEMQCNLWAENGIVCQDVGADGNCGVEMLMDLEENALLNANLEAASREDVLLICANRRAELKEYWLSVRYDPFWQALFGHFCQGHIDLDRWNPRKVQNQQNQTRRQQSITPQRPTGNNPELPFTPDKVVEKGRQGRVLGHKDAVPNGVMVPSDQIGEKAKKKRTGLPRPLSERITFQDYFCRFLADRGVTYRSWTKKHKEDLTVIVFLAGNFPLGQSWLGHPCQDEVVFRSLDL